MIAGRRSTRSSKLITVELSSLPATAHPMTQSWPLSRQQVLDADGRPMIPARVHFFVGGTTTPLAVYSDSALTIPLAQPVERDLFKEGKARGDKPLRITRGLPAGAYGFKLRDYYLDEIAKQNGIAA